MQTDTITPTAGGHAAAPLDEVLHHLRMSGTFYCSGQFESPWGVAIPPLPGEGRFHLVTEGSAVVFGEGFAPLTLHRGDFVLLPRGLGHNLADVMGSPLTPYCALQPQRVAERYAQYQQGGGGPGTRLVCVSVSFEDTTVSRLLSLLPPVIHVRGDSPDRDAMDQVVRLLAQESQRPRAGGAAIVTRLADILVVQAMRWWIEHECCAQLGWLGALRDPHIGRVVALIHRRPEHPWTLAVLAREVGLSRSALALRFKDLMGQPVMRYLATWRMQLALASLRQQGRVDIGQLAERVGYQSESAFNRAFKRHVGQPPGAARAAHLDLLR
jgi:AraC-like DNA-binding protein